MSGTIYAKIGISHSEITLSNDNLTADSTTFSSYRTCLSTISKTSGKWYWEAKADRIGNELLTGICTASQSLTSYPGQSGTDGYSWFNGGRYYRDGTYTSGTSFVANDILMFALDLDSGKLWFGKNGTWNQGDPANDLLPVFSGIASANGWHACPGGLTSSQITMNFGQQPFLYSVPLGFNEGLFDASYQIMGVVRENGIPVIRTLRAYRRDNGALLSQITSDSNGHYTFDLLYGGHVYVVALDDDYGADFNALIFDKIIPTE